jgi:hypothetical protein
MDVSDVLRNARELYVGGKHQLRVSDSATTILLGDLLLDAARGNGNLAADANEALDRAAPGGAFSFWADGGKWTDEGAVYEYNRRPAEVAAAFGKAILASQPQ